MEKADLRLIVLSDGSGMGDSVYVFETDAPIERLKELEKESNEVYLNGGDAEDVPIWAVVLTKGGYTFGYVDECRHITPHGTSEEWLENKYPQITEKYCIENQPEL